MKKLLLILMAAALTAVTFTSCSKDDNGNVTVTFDANGGTFDGGESVLVRTVGYGSTVTKPDDPTLVGSIFLGWFLPDSTQWNFQRTVTQDMVLHAGWQKVAPEEGTRLMIISFKDQLGNHYSHVFQYCYGQDQNHSLKLDTIKVGPDAYPLVYQEKRVFLTNSTANWGRINFENEGEYTKATSFLHASGGEFDTRYNGDFLDSLAYWKGTENTIIAKGVKLKDINTIEERVYDEFDTDFSDSPSHVVFSYSGVTAKNNRGSHIFTPGFFTYAFIENAWKSTQQGVGESILAMAVFNTDFFGEPVKTVPTGVQITEGNRIVNLGINSSYTENETFGYALLTVDIVLPESSYYSEATFYEVYPLSY